MQGAACRGSCLGLLPDLWTVTILAHFQLITALIITLSVLANDAPNMVTFSSNIIFTFVKIGWPFLGSFLPLAARMLERYIVVFAAIQIGPFQCFVEKVYLGTNNNYTEIRYLHGLLISQFSCHYRKRKKG